MKNLHNELFHQVDYIGLNDEQKITFIKELVEDWGISSIIAEILQSSREEDIFIVSLLLRDVSLHRRGLDDFNEIVDQFRIAVKESDIFQLMNKNLYLKDRLIRETTYVTFGKMSFPQNSNYLKDAISYYMKHFELTKLQFCLSHLVEFSYVFLSSKHLT